MLQLQLIVESLECKIFWCEKFSFKLWLTQNCFISINIFNSYNDSYFREDFDSLISDKCLLISNTNF